MINGSALNIGTINGTGGNRVIEALAAIDALSECNAAAWALCLPTSTVGASANVSLVQTSIIQRHAPRAIVQAVADMLAGVPKMKYASSSMVLSSGAASVDAYKIAQPISVDMDTTCLFGGTPYIDADGKADAAVAALCSGTAFGIMLPRPEVTTTAQAQAVAVRRCPSLSAVLTKASVTADGGYTIAGHAALSCKASISATAGYGVPSLGMLTCRAGMYVYGRQVHQCSATLLARCAVDADAIAGFGGISNVNCRASVAAIAIAEQGQCDDLTGRAIITANAEYWYMAHAATTSVSLLTADSFVIRDGKADVVGKPVMRVETKVNNQLEGYSDPTAQSVLGINVNGVAVAISIAHIHAYVDATCDGTYRHMARANGGATCSVQPNGVLVHQAWSAPTVSATVQAGGHWEWYGDSSFVGQCDAGAMPSIRYSIGTTDVDNTACSATILSRATYGHGAYSTVLAESLVLDGDVNVIRYADAIIDCVAVCDVESIGNPDTRDPLERTMYRPYVERMMTRPYIDRRMTTTSA